MLMIKAVVALNMEKSEEKHRPQLPCQRYYPQFVRLCVVTSIRDDDQPNSYKLDIQNIIGKISIAKFEK